MVTLCCQYKGEALHSERVRSEITLRRTVNSRKEEGSSNGKPNMSPVFSAVILFCIGMVKVSQACVCFPSDTQDDFCRAAIVFRARVWSGPKEALPDKDDEFSSFYRDQVYSLKIVEIFKGEKEISHLSGVVSVGVRSPSLMADLHTPTKFSSCSFGLHKGREYLLSGYVLDNKLRSSFCDLRQEWTYVTPQQRAGLNGHYNKNC